MVELGRVVDTIGRVVDTAELVDGVEVDGEVDVAILVVAAPVVDEVAVEVDVARGVADVLLEVAVVVLVPEVVAEVETAEVVDMLMTRCCS